MPSAPISERPSIDLAAHDRPAPERQPESDRRVLIAAAAERAFVRHGFHAATMQQVAEEAGMSAGNLYRYFPSKEALVEGICAIDQRERAAAFKSLAASEDILGVLSLMLSEHVLNKPRHKMLMVLEIGAEAARNPRIAAMSRAIDAEVLEGLAGLIEAAKASGQAVATLDSPLAARFMFTFVSGLMRRRALESDFDVPAAAAMTMGMVRALFAGAISLSPEPESR
jgi:AcrR family transcriptional regulator